MSVTTGFLVSSRWRNIASTFSSRQSFVKYLLTLFIGIVVGSGLMMAAMLSFHTVTLGGEVQRAHPRDSFHREASDWSETNVQQLQDFGQQIAVVDAPGATEGSTVIFPGKKLEGKRDEMENTPRNFKPLLLRQLGSSAGTLQRNDKVRRACPVRQRMEWAELGLYPLGGGAHKNNADRGVYMDKLSFHRRLIEYVSSYRQCRLSDTNIVPLTYDLSSTRQCENFFASDTRTKNSWIVKPLASEGGSGIRVFHNITKLYLELDKCKAFDRSLEMGRKRSHVVQRYLRYPHLIDGRKFDIRMYLIIARARPWMLFYGGGFLRVTIAQYDPASEDRSITLTNTKVQTSLKEHQNRLPLNTTSSSTKYNGKDHIWSLDKWEKYLVANKKVREGWIERVFVPEVKRIMRFFFESRRSLVEVSLHETSLNTFALMGLDFMVTDTGHPVLLEANSCPAFNGAETKFEDNLKTQIFKNMYWLLRGLHADCAVRGGIREKRRVICSGEAQKIYCDMREGDKFGPLELIMSDCAVGAKVGIYNPCNEFPLEERLAPSWDL